jgi:hypothetical protein
MLLEAGAHEPAAELPFVLGIGGRGAREGQDAGPGRRGRSSEGEDGQGKSSAFWTEPTIRLSRTAPHDLGRIPRVTVPAYRTAPMDPVR